MKQKISLVFIVFFIVSCSFMKDVKHNIPATAVDAIEKIVTGVLTIQSVSSQILIELGLQYGINLSDDLTSMNEALLKIRLDMLSLKNAIEQSDKARGHNRQTLDILRELDRLSIAYEEIPLS